MTYVAQISGAEAPTRVSARTSGSSRLVRIGRLRTAADEWRRYYQATRAHEQKGAPILITGAQRSGTTWFGQMLHVEGTRLYHEPLGRYGVLWHPDENYAYSDGVDREGLYNRLDTILSGREWNTFNWPHWNPKQRTTTRLSPVRFLGMERGRVIIKDPTACGMLEVITSRCPMEVVMIFRHPCGYASSLKKLNWNPDRRLQTLFDHPAFADHELARFRELYKGGRISEIEKYVLQLGLLYTLLFAFKEKYSAVRAYFYEDLAAEPVSAYRGVFQDLGLRYTDGVRKLHSALSRSGSNGEIDRHAVQRESAQYVGIWKNRLSEQEVTLIRKMWDRFDFGLYTSDNQWK